MISHTEIIVLAIKQVESRLERLKVLSRGREEIYKEVSKDLYKQWNDLTDLYRIETGAEYT